MTNTIDKDKAKELINQSNGRIFSAVFIKKDNTHRLINARIKVNYKAKTDRSRPYEPSKYNLLCVYDMQKKQHRMININTLQTLILNKRMYNIKE
jgi:hypothetical protein